MIIHLVELSTGHFEFRAVVRDYPEADMDYLLWLLQNDANVMTVDLPGTLRDGEALYAAP